MSYLLKKNIGCGLSINIMYLNKHATKLGPTYVLRRVQIFDLNYDAAVLRNGLSVLYRFSHNVDALAYLKRATNTLITNNN